MSEGKRPNSRRNLDIAIECMVEGRGDPLRTRTALAAAESEVEGLTSIRYDIVSLLVTGTEKALLRHHKNVLNDGR